MIKKIICLMLLFCISCTNSNNNKNIDKETHLFVEPESLYRLAKISFDEKNFEQARIQFLEINRLFLS